VSGDTGKMDAYDIYQKIQKYWMVLTPKNSGELPKSKTATKVIVLTDDGYREVCGVVINDGHIELLLDNE
jgi:hypothetical protein